MRKGLLDFIDAVLIFGRAESLLADNEYDVATAAVLRLANASGCSAYDCEFITLAQHLNVKLVSADAKQCKAFPKVATSLCAT